MYWTFFQHSPGIAEQKYYWGDLGVCHVPEEFVVQEVVGEEELQKQIITGARVDVNKAPTHYQQSTIKAPER